MGGDGTSPHFAAMQNLTLGTPTLIGNNPVISYVAELKDVTEVSLVGLSDLAFWRERLARETLTPVERDGCAVVIIMAATMRFLGTRFSELSVSVQVLEHDGGEAAFLLQAFNSNRLLALCERTFFGTPYRHGVTSMCTDAPVSISLSVRGDDVFHARMQREVPSLRRQPLRVGEDGWTGRVFVPCGIARKCTSKRFFFAKITGYTRTYAFETGCDVFSIAAPAEHEVFRCLRASNFVPLEWLVRDNATHGKSRTYRGSNSASAHDEGSSR